MPSRVGAYSLNECLAPAKTKSYSRIAYCVLRIQGALHWPLDQPIKELLFMMTYGAIVEFSFTGD
jgi:hypothetical protein